jgi:outer membrane protein OmpA-like peptidoglycan-associated protein
MTRKPAFWIAFAVLAALCAALAWRLFPLAIPIVNLDIEITRDGAVDKAKALATARALAPPDARTAVRFSHDQATQNYVELEGGGKPAFASLVAGDVYAPYRWEVRLFRTGEITETVVRLKPDGAPLGFVQKIPEAEVPKDPAGLALDARAARAVAEARAQQALEAAQQAERDRAELRETLQRQLNLILETRETARGLVANMSDVLFDTASASLKPGPREKLARVAGVLLAYPALQIAVEGHTDSVGDDDDNQALSERRAASVRHYLVSQGISQQTIDAMGFGESRPLVTNTTAAGRQQNRRVELVISGESIAVPTDRSNRQ